MNSGWQSNRWKKLPYHTSAAFLAFSCGSETSTYLTHCHGGLLCYGSLTVNLANSGSLSVFKIGETTAYFYASGNDQLETERLMSREWGDNQGAKFLRR